MWRRVHLVWTYVSEELIASIFRVEKSASEEAAWAGGCSHIPEDGILHRHRRENLKSYNFGYIFDVDYFDEFDRVKRTKLWEISS
jgi:hypothetical protein